MEREKGGAGANTDSKIQVTITDYNTTSYGTHYLYISKRCDAITHVNDTIDYIRDTYIIQKKT